MAYLPPVVPWLSDSTDYNQTRQRRNNGPSMFGLDPVPEGRTIQFMGAAAADSFLSDAESLSRLDRILYDAGVPNPMSLGKNAARPLFAMLTGDPLNYDRYVAKVEGAARSMVDDWYKGSYSDDQRINEQFNPEVLETEKAIAGLFGTAALGGAATAGVKGAKYLAHGTADTIANMLDRGYMHGARTEGVRNVDRLFGPKHSRVDRPNPYHHRRPTPDMPVGGARVEFPPQTAAREFPAGTGDMRVSLPAGRGRSQAVKTPDIDPARGFSDYKTNAQLRRGVDTRTLLAQLDDSGRNAVNKLLSKRNITPGGDASRSYGVIVDTPHNLIDAPTLKARAKQLGVSPDALREAMSRVYSQERLSPIPTS